MISKLLRKTKIIKISQMFKILPVDPDSITLRQWWPGEIWSPLLSVRASSVRHQVTNVVVDHGVFRDLMTISNDWHPDFTFQIENGGFRGPFLGVFMLQK